MKYKTVWSLHNNTIAFDNTLLTFPVEVFDLTVNQTYNNFVRCGHDLCINNSIVISAFYLLTKPEIFIGLN